MGRSTTVTSACSHIAICAVFAPTTPMQLGKPRPLVSHLWQNPPHTQQRVVADTADFERVHSQHLTRLPHVARVHSSFALRAVQKSRELPIK